MNYTTSAVGRKLVEDFEGCELTAYIDAVGIITIGYGHTGPDVHAGLTITKEEAIDILIDDLKRFENVVNTYTTVDITQAMFDAMTSFAFNCGGDAFKNSTLLRLLNNKDYEGAAGQFSRWVNGNNGPLPGLVRRRAAEEELFRSGGFPDGSTTEKPKKVTSIVATHDTVLKKEPVQSSTLADDQKVSVKSGKTYGVSWHGQEGDNHIKVTLTGGAGDWFIYTPHWEVEEKDQNTPPTPANSGEKVLDTRYFSQRDNYRDASRTCFSSSCAMLLETLKPGTLPGERGDDKYVQTVFSIGDTTEAWVQLQALRSYGVEADFVQNGNVDLVKSQIDKGFPVPIGILHSGPASAPSGGGHWICVIGYNDKGFIVHDPWGEITHSTGYYDNTDGERLLYSYKGIIANRWTVAHPNDGWAIIAK